jgi:hypothetical protein
MLVHHEAALGVVYCQMLHVSLHYVNLRQVRRSSVLISTRVKKTFARIQVYELG